MLFKKRTDVVDYCSMNISILFSQEREKVWLQLKKDCNDSSLNNVENQKYYDHMRAVILELMHIAITKKCKWQISSDARMFTMNYLNEHDLNSIEDLQDEYNKAFGSSYTDGIASMISLFNELLTSSKMQESTIERFYAEFYTMIKIFFDNQKSIKLVTKNP
jgi:glutamate-1-semialdehyde aminotransferase